MQRWERFASRLDAAGCVDLLARAAARRLTTGVVVPFTSSGSTDGWALETRGYLSPGALAPRESNRSQRQLVW